MPLPEHNLTKLSLEELDELYGRQNNILKNKKLISQLPDKGKQLQEKLEKVEKELELRKTVEKLEREMKILSIQCENKEEKHIQHMCHMEKSPKKERYKPFSTLVPNAKNKTEKLTQMIPLTESIVLLAEQATKLPIDQLKKAMEGTEMKETDGDEQEES